MFRSAIVLALTSVGIWLAAPGARAQDGGTGDAGAMTTTGTGTGTGSGGTSVNSPQCGTNGAAIPWAGSSDVTDGGQGPLEVVQQARIVDNRPPPTAEQVQALQEMEAEVASFQRLGTSYRDTVTAIVRREYLQQRRARDEGYARQIRVEEQLQDEARENAIRLFERFIERYPNDPTYTPDAMFRLGELYYERSANAFQDAIEAAQNARAAEVADGGTGDDIPDPMKDFSATINLYRRIVIDFGNYRHIDGVLYLIGYCLNEMNQVEEAMAAWRHLVCVNRYDYDAAAAIALLPDAGPGGDAGPPPDSGPEPDAGTPVDAVYVDPYADCQPITQGTEFFGEVWLRIGEYHFDNDFSAHGLDRAISAYTRVLAIPTDRNYNLALYKTAWSYYRASRYPEALHAFEQLVQWSDDEERRTGRAGTELRAEAIQYIGLTFAYDDWNENQTPDPQEGQPTGFVRVQDPTLMPQDRPWSQEVYNQLAQVYFDEAKYYQAIEVWKYILQKWPLAPAAPEVNHMISRAYRRHAQAPEPGHPEQATADQENATTYDAYQGNYGIGSTWYNANNDHPEEQRRAEELAEGTIINAAITYHQRAQTLRAMAAGEQSTNPAAALEHLHAAQEQYRLAAQAYRAYIQRYPNNPQAYELNYNLADALYFSEDYEGAAQEYAAVRDSNLDDSHLGEAARRVVESVKRILDAALANHQIEIRSDPPDPVCTPPAVIPIPMPQLLLRLARARKIYLDRVDDAHDTEHVRDGYDYNNTLLLYVYGYWAQARQNFERILEERCIGPNADDTGHVAWLNLRNMAVALQQPDEVHRLGAFVTDRGCTFTPSTQTCTQDSQCGAGNVCSHQVCTIDCHLPANHDRPQCQVAGQIQIDFTNEAFRLALDKYHEAERASGDEQTRLFEDAATLLIHAVDNAPTHPEAPRALALAAGALEHANRFSSAARIYQRIIDELGPQHDADPARQADLDEYVSNAYFRLAFSANHNFDYDRAIQNYRVLTDSPRFVNHTAPAIVRRREDALVNVAEILVFQQQYTQATQYYQRLATQTHDPDTQRSAYYQIAEMSHKQHNWTNTVRDMQSFIDRYRSVQGSADLLMQAQWAIVEARRNQHNQRALTQALQDTVDLFARVGGQPGSLSAEYAAQAKFEIIDASPAAQAFSHFAITAGHPATMAAYVSDLASQISTGAHDIVPLVAAYEPIIPYRRPTWSIAALVAQAKLYETFRQAILNTPFTIPADLAHQLAQATHGMSRADAAAQTGTVHDTILDRIHQQVLDPRAHEFDCLAIVRYALAARAARAASLDTDATRAAINGLSAYGEEDVNACMATGHAQDPAVALAQPGEFARARTGQTLTIPAEIAPPPFAPEDQ